MLIDGEIVSRAILEELKKEVYSLGDAGTRASLAVIRTTGNQASKTYANKIIKSCNSIGMGYYVYEFSNEVRDSELLEKIHELNARKDVNGILVQFPLPSHIDANKIIKSISYKKDIDCLNPKNSRLLCMEQCNLAPCTPSGIIELIKYYNIETAGKECVIVGRSNIVGKPLIQLMLNENATVTVAHSHTPNLKEVCKRADILIVAIGKPKFINREYVKDGAVVVDVGINRDENNNLCGDVDFEDVKNIVSAITPVPGGVGATTVAMSLCNCVKLLKYYEINDEQEVQDV